MVRHDMDQAKDPSKTRGRIKKGRGDALMANSAATPSSTGRVPDQIIPPGGDLIQQFFQYN